MIVDYWLSSDDQTTDAAQESQRAEARAIRGEEP